MSEQVDILLPPTFKKSGQVKDRNQAWTDGDWIGTFNLWILRNNPEPAIIYQVRSNKSSWAPNKLDVTAGGHYTAGENIKDGLREVKEELGKEYAFDDLFSLGRKLHIDFDQKQRIRKNVVDIFFTVDNSPLDTYVLEEAEIHAVCICPINKLILAHQEEVDFDVEMFHQDGSHSIKTINKNSFPYNWDNYHLKIATLAQKYLAGDHLILY